MQYNLSVRKGNTFTLPLRFGAKDASGTITWRDISSSTFVFRAAWGSGENAGSIRKASGTDAAWVIGDQEDEDEKGKATLTLSFTETRSTLPAVTIPVLYEIEERSGGDKQVTKLFGRIVQSEWVNDDV